MHKIGLIIICYVMSSHHGNAQIAEVGQPLPFWKEGYLDIHHTNTGRGNAAYCILPDGTSLLIDAGELTPLDARTFSARNAVIRPDPAKKPFQWLVNYIQQVSPSASPIDYALITHFHDDHFGAWYPEAPLSASKKFSLTGITGVGELIPIRNLVDRGYPEYKYPYNLKTLAATNGSGEIEFAHTMNNYFAFIQEKKAEGMEMIGLKAGSRGQIHLLKKPTTYPSFYIQNIKANQFIWSGSDSSVIQHFTAIDSTDRRTWPDENSLSLAIAIHYGAFIYYTGGDNPGMVFTGDNPLRDVETPIGKAVGEVDVATMDHHGNRDAINEFFINALRPNVWIGQSWSSDHPGHEVLLRLMNQHIYKGDRDLFATNMLEANKLVIGSMIDRAYKSQQGHIVVRVLPGGNTYYVIILDDSKAEIPVKAVVGPYKTKNKINQ